MANSAGFQLRLGREFSGMKLINMEATRRAPRARTTAVRLDRGRDSFASAVVLIVELARDSSPCVQIAQVVITPLS